MKLIDKVQFITRDLKKDERGWFLKVLTSKEEGISSKLGEVYVTMAFPGQVKGNHYHLLTNEWFTVIQGTATVVLRDYMTNESLSLTLEATQPITLFVPAGIAHAFKNPETSTEPMLLVAYSDQLYEPSDTIPYLAIK